MKPIKVAWPKTEVNRSVMFVAQLLKAMLSPDSFESFRAFSLDSSARLWEYQELIGSIILGKIPIATLEPVFAELEWSLKRDIIANAIAGHELEGFLQAGRDASKRDLRQLRFHTKYVFKIVHENYRQVAEAAIIDLLQSNKKDDLRRATSMFCASLINSGLSRPHLLAHVDWIFFRQDHYKLGLQALRRFFRDIGSGESNFDVYCAFEKGIARNLGQTLQGKILSHRSISPEVLSDLRLMENYKEENLYYVLNVREFDPFEAARIADRYLSNFLAITYLGRRGVDFEWPKEKYVIKRRALRGSVVANQPLIFQKKTSPTGKVFKSFRSQINLIYGCFDQNSIERITSSINTAALARSNNNIESQMISLWSAFEVLLSDPPFGEARVVHYVKLLVPCISVKYTRRYIIGICDELSDGYGVKFKRLLNRLPEDLGIDRYTRFTHLIFDKSFEVTRNDLFQLCSENPLACNRLFKLHSDFGTAAALGKSIDAYAERVNWQLHRIYRARNSLVHAGKMPNYVESLVLNAFEYYRSCIGSILSRAKGSTSRSVDSVVSEVTIQFEDLRRMIKKLPAGNIPVARYSDFYK